MSVHIVFRIFMNIFDIMFIILELSTSDIYKLVFRYFIFFYDLNPNTTSK